LIFCGNARLIEAKNSGTLSSPGNLRDPGTARLFPPMRFTEYLRQAFDSLWSHKLRSMLTLLGIIIGISTLITVVTLIEGADHFVEEQMANLNPDVYQLSQFPRVSLNFNDFIKARKWKPIKYADYVALQQQLKATDRIGVASTVSDLVRRGSQYVGGTTIRGVSASMLEIEKLELADGRYLDDLDESERRFVCVLGKEINENLFAASGSVGRQVNIGGRPFHVVGAAREMGSIFGRSRDKFVLVPITTLFKMYGSDRSVAIYGQVRNRRALDDAIAEARAALRIRRRLSRSQEDTFSFTTVGTIVSMYNRITSSFFVTMVVISSIALVVGGVVVMNIMLVSVRERTREIGIRKSMGARYRDILAQFLVEAILLCLAGGAIGILCGFGFATLIAWLSPFPADVRLVVVAAGLMVSSLVGILAGVYPAHQAARLNPIEALRYE